MSALYRKDIDGLRAIAVLMVVFYHAEFSFISGGFIGVDVFFVISGYLITTVLLRDVGANSFSFAQFYLRRLRRLMPAFIFISVLTTIGATVLLLPSALIKYSESLLAAFLSISNFFFWKNSGGGYFSPGTDELPLLHTWSLSVEEQYYVLWPLFLVISYRYVKRNRLGGVIVVLAVVSLLLSQWLAIIKPTTAYFFLPTRAFELLMGGGVAYYYFSLPTLNRHLNHFLSFVGILFVLGAGFILTDGSTFPGVNALIPCLGACIVIYTGRDEGNVGVINRIISIRPLVFVGLISYSLYLWHWPVFSFLNVLGIILSGHEKWLVIFILILLAYFTWLIIEQPFRHKYKFSFIKTLIFYVIFPVVACIGYAFFIYNSSGYINRFSPEVIVMIDSIHSRSENRNKHCHNTKFKTQTKDRCTLGFSEKRVPDILVVGDSHADAATGMLDVFLRDRSLKGYVVTANTKIYLPGIARYDLKQGKNKEDKAFLRRGNNITQLIDSKQKFNFIVLAGRWASYISGLNDHDKKNGEIYLQDIKLKDDLNLFNSAINFELGMNRAISVITKSGAIPVIVESVAEFGLNKSDCVIRNKIWASRQNCSVDIESVKSRQKKVNEIFENLKKKYPSLIFIDPKKVMCGEAFCYSSLSGVPLYKDDDHFNHVGSKLVGSLYLEKYSNPFIIDLKVPKNSSGNPRSIMDMNELPGV